MACEIPFKPRLRQRFHVGKFANISSCVLGFSARGSSRKCVHWRGSFWKKFLWDLQEKITSKHRKTQNKALRRGSWTTLSQRPLFFFSCWKQYGLSRIDLRISTPMASLTPTLWDTSKQHMKLQQPRNYDFRVSQFALPRSRSGNDREMTTSSFGHPWNSRSAFTITAKFHLNWANFAIILGGEGRFICQHPILGNITCYYSTLFRDWGGDIFGTIGSLFWGGALFAAIPESKTNIICQHSPLFRQSRGSWRQWPMLFAIVSVNRDFTTLFASVRYCFWNRGKDFKDSWGGVFGTFIVCRKFGRGRDLGTHFFGNILEPMFRRISFLSYCYVMRPYFGSRVDFCGRFAGRYPAVVAVNSAFKGIVWDI